MYRLFFLAITVWMISIVSSCSDRSAACSFMKPHQMGLLRIAYTVEPQIIDVRRGYNLSNRTLFHMLYEGLTRIKPDGSVELALADNIEISSNEKIYHITLKKAHWSNGDLITAEDFIYTWKTLLSPHFSSPHAHLLYPIKGAQLAKQGKDFIDAIGVFAVNASTFVIELENPMPEFMHLLSTPAYFPMHHEIAREIDEEGKILLPQNIPYNGPYLLNKWMPEEEIVAIKNPGYWNAAQIKMNTIHLIKADSEKMFSLFEQDDVDWVGSPLSVLTYQASCIETISGTDFRYMKKPRVRDVYFSPLGYLDFKDAWIALYSIDLPQDKKP